MKVIYQINLCINSKLDSELIKIKKRIYRKYDAHYLKNKPYGPHITLFISDKNEIDERYVSTILKKLKLVCKDVPKLKIRINGVGCFTKKTKDKPEGNYVIFLKIEKDQALNKLHSKVVHALADYGKPEYSNYAPHITLTRGDLSRNNLKKIKKELYRYDIKRSFMLNFIVLLTKKNEKEKWTKNYIRLC